MRRTVVFGPAYVDRVIRVDRPLLESGRLDGSMDGRALGDGGTLVLVDWAGNKLAIDRPGGCFDDPSGTILLLGLLGGAR